MKVYIAGKITGDDYNKVSDKFLAADIHLSVAGHLVMRPTCLPFGFSHKDYMHICYAMIDVCDAVYFLNDWKMSKGARDEHQYAKKNHKVIYYQKG